MPSRKTPVQRAPTPSLQRHKRQLHPITTPVFNLALLSLLLPSSNAFVPTPLFASIPPTAPTSTTTASNTALNVWFFGGSESQTTETGDACELVGVQIERTSSNSRRISGEINVEKPLDDVWAILTDYDNLSTHVPNLVESRKVRGYSGKGTQGDGSYTCRLYQKGAQKIIGFQFGADVTMDMVEQTTLPADGAVEKKINFKCVDSLFFSEFDGDWKVTSSNLDGVESTTVGYSVMVRPKGPVPVAALEWRIREDVPTNLRAVKLAAVDVGADGVKRTRKRTGSAVMKAMPTRPDNGVSTDGGAIERVESNGASSKRNGANAKKRLERLKALANRARENVQAPQQVQPAQAMTAQAVPVPVPVQWDDSETMGAYLGDQ